MVCALEIYPRLDFNQKHTACLDARSAVREACLKRLRPILMTTLAAGLGALPLAIGFGQGAELRQPLGVTIIGGLLASQFMTLLTTSAKIGRAHV